MFLKEQSPVDIMTPKFICEVMDMTAPRLLSIIKNSFSSGCVPQYLKTACVQPFIKKSGLHPSECSNYRAISKLPFWYKAPCEDCPSTTPRSIEKRQNLRNNSVRF